MDRAVVLVDMDCFYVQVEQRLNPALKGKPCAVVQYKTYRGGGIIAVGYEARAFGVTRNMMGDDARKVCPDIQFARVPEVRGKADLTKYREAGAEVIEVMSQFSSCVERASIDEAYLDLTKETEARLRLANSLSGKMVTVDELPNTFVGGWCSETKECDKEKVKEAEDGRMHKSTAKWLTKTFDSEETSSGDRLLAMAAVIVEEMRAAIFEQTGFTCSAGIAHNKMLAKLACGLHKPNKQTVIPHGSVDIIFSSLPLHKVRSLGGKLGQSLMEELGVRMMGDLKKFSLQHLQALYGDKSGLWLHQACQGLEYEAVSSRQLAKSIGCSKMFRGKEKLDTKEKVKFWVGELAKEVTERLLKDRENNKRTAKSMTVYFRYMAEPTQLTGSRTCPLHHSYNDKKMAEVAYTLLLKISTAAASWPEWTPPITMLGLSASKFEEEQVASSRKITSMFASAAHSNLCSSPLITLPCPSQSNQLVGVRDITPSSTGCSSKLAWDPGSQLGLTHNVSGARSTGSAAVVVRDRSSYPNPLSFLHISSDQWSPTPQLTPCPDPKKKKSTSLKFYFKQSIQWSESQEGTQDTSVRGKEGSRGNEQEERCVKKGFFASRQKQQQLGVHSFHSERWEAAGCSVTKHKEPDCFSYLLQKAGSSDRPATVIQPENFEQPCLVLEEAEEMASSDSTVGKGFTLKSDPPKSQVGTETVYNQHSDSINWSDERSSSTVTPSTVTSCNAEDSKWPGPPNAMFSHSNRLQDEDLMVCDKCGQTLPVWEMPEHSDFHFAMELQQSDGPPPSASPLSLSDKVGTGSCSKRKSSERSGGRRGRPRKVSALQSSSLLAFFTKD
ncbi:DNA polymerase eta-like [Babylonia areolata]|uniref:DNA polymerase eta-like n=1 Tax=Babylonia areolata TaxID=304850 RepID=UPI003FD603E9